MIHLCLLPAYTFLLFYVMWILFLAVMNLKRAKDAGNLSPVAHALGLPLLLFGLTLDWVANLTILSLLLFELPREWTVSERLSRHIHDPSGWRQKIAKWVCGVFLDSFDPSGPHCH